jgi:hypothetical protein
MTSATLCWGSNIGGTLGNGSDLGPISSSVASLTINPVAVAGLNDAVAIKSAFARPPGTTARRACQTRPTDRPAPAAAAPGRRPDPGCANRSEKPSGAAQ